MATGRSGVWSQHLRTGSARSQLEEVTLTFEVRGRRDPATATAVLSVAVQSCRRLMGGKDLSATPGVVLKPSLSPHQDQTILILIFIA